MAQVLCIPVADVFEVNTYLYLDEASGHAFLIDPGAQAKDLLQLFDREGIVVERILLTHGHFDHTGAVAEIAEALTIPYSIHREGLAYLADTGLNLSAQCGRSTLLPKPELFDDGDEFSLAGGSGKLSVIHTPGHTPDSCLLYAKEDGLTFVGDTIFKGSVGTDCYPGGNAQALRHSILRRIFNLPEETILFSGHSDPTDVATEKRRYGL